MTSSCHIYDKGKLFAKLTDLTLMLIRTNHWTLLTQCQHMALNVRHDTLIYCTHPKTFFFSFSLSLKYRVYNQIHSSWCFSSIYFHPKLESMLRPCYLCFNVLNTPVHVLQKGSFWEWAQPMRGDVTRERPLSLAEPISRMISVPGWDLLHDFPFRDATTMVMAQSPFN